MRHKLIKFFYDTGFFFRWKTRRFDNVIKNHPQLINSNIYLYGGGEGLIKFGRIFYYIDAIRSNFIFIRDHRTHAKIYYRLFNKAFIAKILDIPINIRSRDFMINAYVNF